MNYARYSFPSKESDRKGQKQKVKGVAVKLARKLCEHGGCQDGPLGRVDEGNEGPWLVDGDGVETERVRYVRPRLGFTHPPRRVVHAEGRRRITSSLRIP